MEHLTRRVTQPGEMSGPKPTQYGKGRLCLCGTVMNSYTKGDWCNLCRSSSERRARITQEKNMEPASMKTRELAELFGIAQEAVPAFAARNGIDQVKKGGRGRSATWNAEQAAAVNASLRPDAPEEDPVRDTAQVMCADPDCANKTCDSLCQPQSVTVDQQDGSVDDCCQPSSSGVCGEDACCADPTKCAELDALTLEFGEAYREHLQSVDASAAHAELYLEHIGKAQQAATRAIAAQNALSDRGVKIEGMFAKPPFAAELELKTSDKDPEIEALHQVSGAMHSISPNARARVVDWAIHRFGIVAPLPPSR